jgi:surface antigen
MSKRFAVAAFTTALMFSSFVAPAHAQSGWQCVTFARFFSGIQIFGDAWTWWQGAMGKYARGFTPEAGSVLVFKPSGAMRLGHVAVVSQVLSDRIIQVTHANWSPIGGRRGQVEKDVTVIDVSEQGDWSKVKVWYDPTRDIGGGVYPTYGFIYKAAQRAAHSMMAQAGTSIHWANAQVNRVVAANASSTPASTTSQAPTLVQAAVATSAKVATLSASQANAAR